MELPAIFKGESITRLIQGTVFGAIAAAVVGFNWGGWMLGSTADKQTEEGATSAIVALLAPLCVTNFQNATDAVSNLEEFKDKSTYRKTAYVEEGGWAKLPGAEKSNKGVAKACAVLLTELEAPVKS